MGKSAPTPPAAPNPVTNSKAQTASNQATALYQFGLNNPNTNTPLGDINYNVDTSNPNLPKTTANVTLTPEVQQLLDQYQQNTTQQGQVANTALQGVQGQFNTPYNLQGNVSATPSQQDLTQNLQDTRDSIYKAQTQYLDPQFQQQQDQLNAQLANQGIPQGSEAWNHAMQNQGLQKQQAYQQAFNQAQAGGTAAQAQEANTGLANQAQQAQMYTQQYQAPLSLYNSLMTGTQPNLPQFQGAQGSQVAPTNVLGAYNSQYQGQLNSYNAAVGSQNSMMSGLGSLGSALGSAWIMSDERLKKNIKQIGYMKNGLPWYEFSYIWGDQKYEGVMAQEVEQVIPEAVLTDHRGFKMVRYDLLGA